MVPVNNPLALAEKMAYFLLHRGDIAQMGLAARQEVRDFRPEVGAKRLVQFLSDLLQRKNSFPPDLPPKTPHYSPTWKAFTTPDSISARIWKEARQGSKSAVIRLGNSMRRQSRPHSHRILVYHLVLKEDRKSFDEQMKYLKDRFLICSIPEMMKHIGVREGSSAFRAAITFDDGFRVLMDDCLEILEKHNLRASFFIPAGFVELAGQREMAARFSLKTHHYNLPLEPMGPKDLQTLVRLGHGIGSHGMSHIGLSSMSKQRAMRELELSAQRIEEWTNIHPTGFAYPYGDTVSVLGDPTQWLAQAGYIYGLTLRRGKVQSSGNPFLLPRDHAEGNWKVRDLRFFLMK
jgi:peptidoglycan/xylan/chitin deacetylase (PgdA/CDA1 family)